MVEYAPLKLGISEDMLWVTFANFQRYNYHDKRVRWKFYYRRKSTQLLLKMKGQICLFIPRYQRTQATFRISERLMPLDEYPCIFSRLMVAIVHLMPEQNHTCNCGFSFGLNQLNYRFLAQDNHLHRTKYICSGLEWMSRFLRRKLNFKFPIIRFLLRTLDVRREKVDEIGKQWSG